MMQTIFNLIGITSIWVLGLTIATQPKMILFFLREKAEEKKGEKEHSWWDPIILCHWCMSSIHGIAGYLFAVGTGVIPEFHWQLLIAYPIVVCGSSIVCGIVWALYKKIEIHSKHLENMETLSHYDLKDRRAEHNKNKDNHKQRQTVKV